MIPFSELVSINSRTIGGGLAGLDFNGLLLSTSASIPIGVALSFSNADDVGDYFGLTSDEYALSQTYFTADTNASKRPSLLLFYRHLNAAAGAWLRGAEYTGTLDDLKAVTAGGIKLSIDGTEVDLSGITFASATSFSAVAQALQTKIVTKVPSATVVYDTTFNAFIIKSGTTGDTSTITYTGTPTTGTDIGELLNMTDEKGAVISQGSAVKTYTQTMINALKQTQNFVSFMPVAQETEAESQELATWCNSKGTRFMYVYTETSALVANSVTTATFANKVSDFFGVCSAYNTKAFSAGIMGVAGSIDWSKYNGRKILTFRTLGSLTPTCSDSTQANNLLANGYNFYGSYGNANNDINLLQNGKISGSAKWIDTYLGQVFLANRLENAWINIMANANTIPYNEDGYGLLRASAQDVIEQALNAGIIRQGVSLSNSQKAQVNAEAGVDIGDVLSTVGYYLQILDPTAEVRAQRGSPVINLWYMDGGSVQKIVATSTTIL